MASQTYGGINFEVTIKVRFDKKTRRILLLILCFVLGIVTIAVGIYFYILYQSYYNCGDMLEFKKSNYKHYKKCKFFYNNEWAYYTTIISGGIISCISIIAIITLAVGYSGIININDKISLYETENSNIEQQISIIIENYKGWESDSCARFKNENPTVIISLFPELKSNELVGKQMEVYITNNQKIKELKERKLDYKVDA